MTPLTPTIWVRTAPPSRGTQRPWGAVLVTVAPDSSSCREPGAIVCFRLGIELDYLVVVQVFLFSLLLLPVVIVLIR